MKTLVVMALAVSAAVPQQDKKDIIPMTVEQVMAIKAELTRAQTEKQAAEFEATYWYSKYQALRGECRKDKTF